MTPTTIPITVTPEAAARVAELGMQAELEQMLQQTRRTVPCLQSIKVVEALPYDTGDETSIVIEAYRDDPYVETDRIDTELGRWMVTTFPPDMCRYCVIMAFYNKPGGGGRSWM
jgi:hypothetical protein